MLKESKEVLLQWGRGRSPAEMSSSPPSTTRRISRFNGAAGDRPRRFAGHRVFTRHFRPLQWGRGRSPAEIRMVKWCDNLVVRLQWGRGRSPAEISLPIKAAKAKRLGFNGAAGDRPRRSPFFGEVPSCCPSRFNGAAGDRPRRSRNSRGGVRRAGHGASMGPRAIARGDRRHLGEGLGIDARFNGAAGDRPRRCGTCRRRSRFTLMRLQWGRGRSPAEML